MSAFSQIQMIMLNLYIPLCYILQIHLVTKLHICSGLGSLAWQPSHLSLHHHFLHLQISKSGHKHVMWTCHDMFRRDVNIGQSLQCFGFRKHNLPKLHPGDWAEKNSVAMYLSRIMTWSPIWTQTSVWAVFCVLSAELHSPTVITAEKEACIYSWTSKLC